MIIACFIILSFDPLFIFVYIMLNNHMI